MARKMRSIVLALLLVASFVTLAAGGTPMSVQVKQGQVRANPSFLGRIVATLAYGDRVETLEESGGWFKVVVAGKQATGWMHKSALSRKKIVLSAGSRSEQAAASRGELALAGKGFNSDIEAEFRKGQKRLDFATIDRMQAIKVSQEEIGAFAREGGLAPAGGGSQ